VTSENKLKEWKESGNKELEAAAIAIEGLEKTILTYIGGLAVMKRYSFEVTPVDNGFYVEYKGIWDTEAGKGRAVFHDKPSMQKFIKEKMDEFLKEEPHE
jgi:hypothetical protein